MEPASDRFARTVSEGADASAPDLLAPVVAFRNWRVTEDGLRSPRVGTPWRERVVEATCRPQRVEDLVLPPHDAPDARCDCGIHAYQSPKEEICTIDFRGVSGVVTLWGRMCVYEDEIRAQYARVECLGIYSRWARRQKDAVRDVAEELGCDLLDLRELAYAAALYADPLPPMLRPRRPRTSRRAAGESGHAAGRMLLVAS
jgi:hypothetical protein